MYNVQIMHNTQYRIHIVMLYAVCEVFSVFAIHYTGYINRLASLQGRPNTPEKQPYITPKSNPSKVQKTLAGPIVHLKQG